MNFQLKKRLEITCSRYLGATILQYVLFLTLNFGERVFYYVNYKILWLDLYKNVILSKKLACFTSGIKWHLWGEINLSPLGVKKETIWQILLANLHLLSRFLQSLVLILDMRWFILFFHGYYLPKVATMKMKYNKCKNMGRK